MHYRYHIQRNFSSISPERTQDYTPAKYGDVLFAGSGETLEEIGKSAVNLIKSEAYCGGDVLLFRPTVDVDPWFLGYACDCYSSAVQKSLMGRGFTVKHIYGDQLKYLWLVLPPRSEQSAIIRYLNHLNLQISKYIRAKQKLIKLLEEQKQAIIHRAVTRGLDPNVRLKPSGVEWLGDVPEHWEVMRLRNLVDMRVSNVDKHTREGEEPVRLCNYVDVYRNDHIRAGMNFMSATATSEEIVRFRLVLGDVLITKDSEAWDDIGVPALVLESADDLICGYHLALLRQRDRRLAGTFLFRILQSTGSQYQFHVEANGVTRYGLSHAAIKSIWLPVPPLPEQAAIVRFLDARTDGIATAVDHTHREIALLREYRTRLIADVVTGKLDVRDAAARLPEEAQEPEPLEEMEADTEAEDGGADDTGAAPDEAEA
jgi:type I restriction enzyme S subunit